MPKALSEVYNFACARWVGLERQKMEAEEYIPQTTANMALNFLTVSTVADEVAAPFPLQGRQKGQLRGLQTAA